MRTRRLVAAALLPTLLVTVSACGFEKVARPEQGANVEKSAGTKKDTGAQNRAGAGEIATRNGAAQAGAFAFRQTGHELAGRLSCRKENEGYNVAVVTCKGTTKGGGSALLIANLTKESRVVTGGGAKISDAEILGTVNGDEVFDDDCIGAGCRSEALSRNPRSDDDGDM